MLLILRALRGQKGDRLGKAPSAPHACSKYGLVERAISQGTVSADKIASCIHCNAMENCRTIGEGNPDPHAAWTYGTVLKNSRGN